MNFGIIPQEHRIAAAVLVELIDRCANREAALVHSSVVRLQGMPSAPRRSIHMNSET